MSNFLEEQWAERDRMFGVQVRRQRLRLGWSQDELAKRVAAAGLPDLSQTTISRIEAGTRDIRLSEAEALSEVFGVPFTALRASDADEARLNEIDDLCGRVNGLADEAAASTVEARDEAARLVRMVMALDWARLLGEDSAIREFADGVQREAAGAVENALRLSHPGVPKTPHRVFGVALWPELANAFGWEVPDAEHPEAP